MAAPSGCSLPARASRRGRAPRRVDTRRRRRRPPRPGRPDGQRAGLVDDDGRHPMGRLERLAAADEDPGLRAAAGADHDRGRRRQAHRAGAGDDDDADERRRGRGSAAARDRPTNQTANVPRPPRSRTIGTNTSAIRSASRWIGALEPWARSTSSTIRARAVSRPTRVARMTKRPGRVERRPDDLVARPDRDRDRLAGQHRHVDRGAALDDDAVDRDAFAGPDAEEVADARPPRAATSRSVAVRDEPGGRRAADRPGAGSRRRSGTFARASSQRPSRTSPMMIVEESK